MMDIQIENTTLCNAKCVFCVHKDMKRPKMNMRDSVFGKILEEIERLKSLFNKVVIAGLGEPMLDPGIFAKIKALKNIGLPIHVFTNGTGDIKKLAEEGVNTIYLSMNAIDGKKRFDLMGRDGFESLDSIISGWDFGDTRSLKINFILGWGLIEQEDLSFAKQKYGEKCRINLMSNWAGKIFPMHIMPINFCKRPAEFVHVLVDGRIGLCCFDAEGEIILGNTIEESISSRIRSMYIDGMKSKNRKELPLCNNCTRG